MLEPAATFDPPPAYSQPGSPPLAMVSSVGLCAFLQDVCNDCANSSADLTATASSVAALMCLLVDSRDANEWSQALAEVFSTGSDSDSDFKSFLRSNIVVVSIESNYATVIGDTGGVEGVGAEGAVPLSHGWLQEQLQYPRHNRAASPFTPQGSNSHSSGLQIAQTTDRNRMSQIPSLAVIRAQQLLRAHPAAAGDGNFANSTVCDNEVRIL